MRVDGVKRSGGRHYLPPARQASQSFFNKENNLQLSGRRLFPPSVGNQDNSPTGRTFGRVSPLCENLASLPCGSSLLRRTGRLASVSADEDLPLDSKQGTPWTSNHGAGGRCSHLGSRKNLPNGVVRQDEGLGGGADERASGGPWLCLGRALCSK